MARGGFVNSQAAVRLPDFIVVGPPRAGTTWLDMVLRRHLGLPSGTKETHFFARNYSQGLKWYESHFRRCAPHLPVGEICPAYFDSDVVRERIATHLPKSRIICTLRDPVARLYSYYRLMRHNGKTAARFEQALQQHRHMLASCRYVFHVEAWRALFGKDRVLVVLYDDLRVCPQKYLDTITGFIGIPRVLLGVSALAGDGANVIETAPRSIKLARQARKFRLWLGSHRLYRTRHFMHRIGLWRLCFEGGEKFPALDAELELRLRDLLRPEAEALERLLRRDLSAWKAGAGTPVPGQNSIREEKSGTL